MLVMFYCSKIVRFLWAPSTWLWSKIDKKEEPLKYGNKLAMISCSLLLLSSLDKSFFYTMILLSLSIFMVYMTIGGLVWHEYIKERNRILRKLSDK